MPRATYASEPATARATHPTSSHFLAPVDTIGPFVDGLGCRTGAATRVQATTWTSTAGEPRTCPLRIGHATTQVFAPVRRDKSHPCSKAANPCKVDTSDKTPPRPSPADALTRRLREAERGSGL